MNSYNTNSIYTTGMSVHVVCYASHGGYAGMLLEYNPVRHGVKDSVSYSYIMSCLAVCCTPLSEIVGGYTIW